MELLTYNGVMFVGLIAVLLADYYLIRRTHIDVPHLFSRSHEGRYWYRGGVNWLAMAVVGATTLVYFKMFNPITLAVARPFHWMGAGMPLLVLAGLLYAGLVMLLGARAASSPSSRATVDIEL